MSSSERYRTYQREYQRKLRADPVKREEMSARKRRLRQEKREQYEASRIAYESRPDVKERKREYNKERLKNPEKKARHREVCKEWKRNNTDKTKEYFSKWESKNKDRRNEYHKKRYWRKRDIRLVQMKRWREENRGLMRALKQEREARKSKATPIWHESDRCQKVYRKASEYGLQVDHIVPIKSDFVCGLHCWDNLQLLSSSDNISKSNRYWPDMPKEAI